MQERTYELMTKIYNDLRVFMDDANARINSNEKKIDEMLNQFSKRLDMLESQIQDNQCNFENLEKNVYSSVESLEKKSAILSKDLSEKYSEYEMRLSLNEQQMGYFETGIEGMRNDVMSKVDNFEKEFNSRVGKVEYDYASFNIKMNDIFNTLEQIRNDVEFKLKNFEEKIYEAGEIFKNLEEKFNLREEETKELMKMDEHYKKIFDEIENKIYSIGIEMEEFNSKLSETKDFVEMRFNELNGRVSKIDDIKIDLRKKFERIKEKNRIIYEMLGEHDILIRTIEGRRSSKVYRNKRLGSK